MSTLFAPPLQPPYYAAIFTSQRTEGDQGYGAMAERMMALAAAQPGYLGAKSVRDASGFGITVSYWDSEAAIAQWKQHAHHLHAQREGQRIWYERFALRVANVERSHYAPD